MTNYKFYRENGKLKRLHLELDETPLDPRYDYDGQVGKMMCWYGNYNLGDYKENDYSDSKDFINDLVRMNIPEKSIISFIKAKRASNGLKLIYNRSKRLWELCYDSYGRADEKLMVIESNKSIDYLIDDIIDAMSIKDKWILLEKYANIVFLPLYLYDHSGITMNTVGFGCKWDSGQAGYIYTDKKIVMDCGGMIQNEKGHFIKVTDKNWKEAAYQWMKAEVEEYDMYLTGDVYGIIVEEYDSKKEDWIERDSCWGFFNNKWGDELIESVAVNFGVTEKLYDKMEEAA